MAAPPLLYGYGLRHFDAAVRSRPITSLVDRGSLRHRHVRAAPTRDKLVFGQAGPQDNTDDGAARSRADRCAIGAGRLRRRAVPAALMGAIANRAGELFAGVAA